MFTADARAARQVAAHIGTLAAHTGIGCFTRKDTLSLRRQQASAYSSTLDCFAQIARKEGLANFYSGSLARCFRVLPGQGIIFMSAEAIYNLLEQKFPPNGGPTHAKGKGHPLKRGVTG